MYNQQVFSNEQEFCCYVSPYFAEHWQLLPYFCGAVLREKEY